MPATVGLVTTAQRPGRTPAAARRAPGFAQDPLGDENVVPAGPCDAGGGTGRRWAPSGSPAVSPSTRSVTCLDAQVLVVSR